MNMMCEVYDLMLKLTSNNRFNLNAEYKISEYFKMENIYTVHNLKLNIEKNILIFLDCDELILFNRRAIAGIGIDAIKEINTCKNIVEITFLDNNNKIIIEFIK